MSGDLLELFHKAKRPVALFVDDAHDLHPRTLTPLKRLVELVTEGGGQLAVILVGHSQLRRDLKRPPMEEIGHRTTLFEFGGLRDRQRDYIDWALRTALSPGIEPDAGLRVRYKHGHGRAQVNEKRQSLRLVATQSRSIPQTDDDPADLPIAPLTVRSRIAPGRPENSPSRPPRPPKTSWLHDAQPARRNAPAAFTVDLCPNNAQGAT
jgi:hypothetical protein